MRTPFVHRMERAKSGVGILITILIIGGLVWLKLSRRTDDSAEIKQQAIEIVESFDISSQQREYCMSLVDRCHDHAFSGAYTLGGRRSAAKFDADAYIQEFLTHMWRLSTADGEKQVAQYVNDYRKALAALSARSQE